jgi:hypothetical protein
MKMGFLLAGNERQFLQNSQLNGFCLGKTEGPKIGNFRKTSVFARFALVNIF